MLNTHLDHLFWEPLTAPDSRFGNYMLAARKGYVLIKNWHNCYKDLWEGRTNADGFHKLPLVQDIGLAEGMADRNFPDEIRKTSDYVAHMLLADLTGNLLDTSMDWNGREFFENKVFMVEGIYNGIHSALRTNLDGHKQVELFTTPFDEPDTEKRQAAEDFVIETLEKSRIYKVYHNSAGVPPALGDPIKKDGFRDIDHRPVYLGESGRDPEFSAWYGHSPRRRRYAARPPPAEAGQAQCHFPPPSVELFFLASKEGLVGGSPLAPTACAIRSAMAAATFSPAVKSTRLDAYICNACPLRVNWKRETGMLLHHLE
ncbi:hypothetical protein DL764_003257 [Monosporascus ibericus]|uniref:Uncharacterized protein n=1 Tax=Monosporascus ibericus TaxID=155417 RepID=A0A4Q4TLS0_9PEZI|nr:hypothetical protein DL764_003257 [Monosporascus ibericus]